MKISKFSINFENNGERWFAGAQNEISPHELAELIEAADRVALGIEIFVEDKRGWEILEWAEQVPGWNDGPDYAPALHCETDIDLEEVLSRSSLLDRVWINGNCWRISE